MHTSAAMNTSMLKLTATILVSLGHEPNAPMEH